MSIRAQLYDLLLADTALTSMLAGGTILNESEMTATSATPTLVLHYLGPGSHEMIPELDVEHWEIRAYDRDQAYFNIEQILERVRTILHRTSLGTDGVTAGFEIMYGWRSRALYDSTFRADSSAMVFSVPVLHLT